ncbi:hypothetical protein [Nitratireductor sp. CH_MIT9313-5]|uniref:hypothetical protein n=1 Tax=Nitratireductor sp. CH_MIT9313-5 TaxID=3107764 RepID=UPI00300A6065
MKPTPPDVYTFTTPQKTANEKFSTGTSAGNLALPRGYRILAPGELCTETLEKAAQVADQYSTKPLVAAKGWDDEQRDYHETGQLDASLAIAAAIRSLKGGSE